FLSVLVTEGADIRAVATAGRTIPAALRRALEERDPTCVIPGCPNRRRLEIDHVIPRCRGGPTRFGKLLDLPGRVQPQPLFKVGGEMDRVFNAVPAHHRQKTFGGWRLSGGPGAWVWEPPRVPPTDWERSPP
ncbi:MAG: HNH endonuclease signature motif containing protein, partial [Actinomycetota bacterium]